MRALKVDVPHAEIVKRYLIQYGLLDTNYGIAREPGAVLFPVVREFSAPFDFDVEFVDVELDERSRGMSLRDALANILTPEEMEELVASYDIVGSIAILEIPDALVPREQLIAQAALAVNSAIKTVLKKIGGHEGEFRTQRMAFLAGEDTRRALVVENGVRLFVHVEEAYYSIRMSTERKRILAQIRPGERVLCLFSGVGPYPIVFSKHSAAASITGVEINPIAHELAVENAAMNRCTNVRLLLGDAHDILPRLVDDRQVFSRVTMPLPHTGAEFLDDAIRVSGPGTVIHYYAFHHESETSAAVETVRAALRRNGRSLASHTITRVGQHAPRIWRVCVDAVVA